MKKYVSELLGTMILVLMGCGSAVFTGGAAGLGQPLTIVICFGLGLIASAYVIGKISGCHINPAVSIGMWVSGRMDFKECIGYIVSQILGGILASTIIWILVSGYPSLVTGTHTGANGFTCDTYTAFIMETIFTFIFVLCVLGSTAYSSNGAMPGLIIGLTLALVNIVGIPITGTSVNPARSIGPALFQGGSAMAQLWVFLTAPTLGGIIAALFWKYLKPLKEE